MEDQEIEAYMRAFTEMNAAQAELEVEQKKAEKLPRDQVGTRLAQMQNITRAIIKQQRDILAQMTRMNNIFSQPAPQIDS